MPTYVYGCDTCGHGFEQIQKFQDAALVTCPECGARIRRIFQPAGIVFKGTGWYSTDSRAERSGSGNGAKKADSGDAKSGGEGAEAGPKKEGDTAKADTAKAETPKADTATKPAAPAAKATSQSE